MKKYLFFIWLVVITAAAYYFFTHGISLEMIQSYFVGMGLWGALVYIIAYTIRPLIFFPTSIMTPLATVMFGPYYGWIFAYVGESFSATIAFFTARFFGRKFVSSANNSFVKKYDKKLTENGFETVLFLRMVPLFPFDFVNYSCGLSGITYKKYIIATLVGVLPGLTAYIFLGGSLMDPRFIIPTILAFVGLTLLAKYLKSRKSILSKSGSLES